MQSAIRKPIATALLLLPLAAAMLVARPAHAQTPHWTPNIPAQVAGVHSSKDVRTDSHGDRDRDGAHASRDDRAPRIYAETPANRGRIEDRGRTHIAARLADAGSGIDTGSVHLRVDGRDVTRATRVRSDEVRYAAALSPGRHAAELVVRDRAGNSSRSAWTFDVVRHEHRG